MGWSGQRVCAVARASGPRTAQPAPPRAAVAQGLPACPPAVRGAHPVAVRAVFLDDALAEVRAPRPPPPPLLLSLHCARCPRASVQAEAAERAGGGGLRALTGVDPERTLVHVDLTFFASLPAAARALRSAVRARPPCCVPVSVCASTVVYPQGVSVRAASAFDAVARACARADCCVPRTARAAVFMWSFVRRMLHAASDAAAAAALSDALRRARWYDGAAPGYRAPVRASPARVAPAPPPRAQPSQRRQRRRQPARARGGAQAQRRQRQSRGDPGSGANASGMYST